MEIRPDRDRSPSDICCSGLAWHTEETTLRQKFEEFGVVDEAVRVDFCCCVGLTRRCCSTFVLLSLPPALTLEFHRRSLLRIETLVAAVGLALFATPTRRMLSARSPP